MNILEYAIARKLAGGGSAPAVKDDWFNDGDTHIWITLDEGHTDIMVGVNTSHNDLTVDWGDGSEPDVIPKANTMGVCYSPIHAYAKAGNYIITIRSPSILYYNLVGKSDQYNWCYLVRHTRDNNVVNMHYYGNVTKVELSPRVKEIGNHALRYYYNIESIAIPNGVQTIGNYALASCLRLKSLVIPESVTSIGSDAFGYCYSLESVTILGSVETIGDYAFTQAASLRVFDCTACTAVPVLDGRYALQNLQPDCEIRVPAALYDEWIAATNWSKYASNIVAV